MALSRPDHALSCFVGNFPLAVAIEHAAGNGAFVCAPPIGLREVIQNLSLLPIEGLRTAQDEILLGHVGLYLPGIKPAESVTLSEFSDLYRQVVNEFHCEKQEWPSAQHDVIQQRFEQRIISLLRQLPEMNILPAFDFYADVSPEPLIYSL
ncbi:MAG: hypothetical protein H6855_05355 [Rhodospirillales bacterium]|nr:hypothetical protein [Rhodospirillales bacterium]MCB9979703.1 hypothetical protein [Rhodospirillales bacterium]